MPALVTAPLALGISNWLRDLPTITRQARNPVYDAFGNTIGSYDTLDAACQGKWFLRKGVSQPPFSQLYVKDGSGRRVPLSTQCVRAASATAAGNTKQAVTPGAAAAAVAAANTAAVGSPAPIDLGAIFGTQTPNVAVDDFGAGARQQQLTTLALWGGLALLGVAAVFSGGRGRA